MIPPSSALSKKSRQAKRFWILGAGHFGGLALTRIARRHPRAAITVVDCKACDLPHGVTADRIEADAVQWLQGALTSAGCVDWIVPAIPEHVAAQWLKAQLQPDHAVTPISVPDAWLHLLPHAMHGPLGRVYTSHADFRCPDDCPEPAALCTHTGRPRPEDLFRLLAKQAPADCRPIVLRSRQLLPGVGALAPAELFAARDLVRRCGDGCLMIATACRCHGVVDFVRVTAPRQSAG